MGVGEGGGCPPPSASDARQMGDQRGPDRSSPSHGSANRLHDDVTVGLIHGSGGIDGTEDLGGGASLILQLELDLVALGHESVVAAGQPDAVDLEPVAQAGLGHPPTGAEVGDEAVELPDEIGIELLHRGGHDAAEEQAAEARRRVGR